jgi:hypothetical protein
MKRLPYIDEHAISIDASAADTGSGLLRVLCRDPNDPSTVPVGFVLAEATPPVRLALKGRHPFAIYRWVFELDAEGPQRTQVRSQTWAAFPGLHGKIYRALVIGSGAHRVVVRRTLKRIAAAVIAEADYADVFEVPILDGDSRTAEQAFRDALGDKPGVLGGLALWIHRHILRFGEWTVVRSVPDELVLAADGPVIRGELTLRRPDGRAILMTRLHYRRRIAARAIWAAVGPLHRVIAPRLMQRSALIDAGTRGRDVRCGRSAAHGRRRGSGR